MELSRHILKEFADVSRGVEREDKTQYLRGTIKSSGEAKYVRIDGSESLTPISEIVDVKDGDRVLVTIENHEATILGNLTMPPSAYKEQEAIDKAEDAQGTAGEAVEKAENAKSLAQSAGDKADAAIVDAGNASEAANQAKQDAAEAITAAGNASKNSTEAKQLATAAGQNAETARQEAALAQNAATAAQGEVTRIEGIVTDVKGDINTALEDVANQAAETAAIKETLSVEYAKKTEVSDVKAALTTEISKKVGELQTTVSQTYAAKNDVVEMEGRLQTQITQTAGEVTSVVGKVEQLESDTTEAQKKVDEALNKSAAAQTAAATAQANATASQAAADAAKANAATATQKATEAAQNAATAAATAAAADKKVAAAQTDLNEAKQNLANTINRVDATEADIAEAQKKVETAQAAVTQAQKDAAEATLAANNAQTAANQAQNDATEAQNAATNAQKKADNAAIAAGNAQAAADKAQQDVAALTKRVTSAETAITQNAEQIKLSATKTEEIGTKLDNLKVGGRNLIVNSEKYTTDRPWQKTIQKVDECSFTEMYFPVVKGRTYTFQFCTNRPVSYHKLDGSAKGEMHVMVYVQDSSLIGTNENNYIIDLDHTKLAYKDGKYISTFAIKSDMDYARGLIRIDGHSDGTTQYNLQCWNFKAEEGNMAGTWEPPVESLATNSNLQNNYYSKTQTDAAIKVAADNVTTTVRKEVTTEITNVNNTINSLPYAGRNILLGSSRYTKDDPFIHQSSAKDGIVYIDNCIAYVEAGKTYTVQLKTDGIWGSHIINGSGKGVTHMFVMLYTDTSESWELAYDLDTRTIINGNTTGHIIMKMKVPADKKYTYGKIRIDIHSDGSTNYKYKYWDFQIEKGEDYHDYEPPIEDFGTKDEVKQAQNDANEANGKADATEERVTVAESTLKQLSDSISMLVTDSNGSSMMTQTSGGWTFNIGAITNAIDNASNNIDSLASSLSQANHTINNLNNLANDLSKKTAYINMTTDDSGSPCIELGKVGNAFKVRITNTSVDFIEGSSKIAYVSNQALFIEKAIIKNELQIGDTFGFIWKTRSNGNLGLRYINARSVFTAIAKYPQSNIDLYSTKDRYENFNISEDPTGCILGSTIKIKVYNTTTNVYNYIECILININSTTQIRIQATGVVTLY